MAGPLTTIAAIAARKEGICCAAITAPPLSTSSAGKARCDLPPDLAVPVQAAPSLQRLLLPVRSLLCPRSGGGGGGNGHGAGRSRQEQKGGANPTRSIHPETNLQQLR